MGFPANLELVYTLCWILGSNNKNIHEHMIIYNMYSEMLFLDIVRNCTHLFVKQTNKQKRKLLFFVTTAENSAVFAQEVESIYLFGNYLLTIQGYIHYYLDM